MEFMEQQQLLKVFITKIKCLKIQEYISSFLIFAISFLKWMTFPCNKSQNHRMANAGRDYWRSSSPMSLFKQDHLEHVTPDCVQMALKYLQGRRLCNLSEQPFPKISHLTVKKLFLMLRWNFLCGILCLCPLILLPSHQEPGPTLLTPTQSSPLG